MIDIWQDGVRVYILPDDNFCLADNEHRSPLDLEECPEGIHIAQGIVSTIRRIRKRELRKGKNSGTWSKRTESDQICC